MEGASIPLLHIPRCLYEQILNHCRQDWPHEACGVLIGDGGVAASAVALRNASSSARTAFAIDPVDQHSVGCMATDRRARLLAVYHSHPESAAYPSAQDQARAPAHADYWLIISMAKSPPDVRTYRMRAGHVLPVPHRIVDGAAGEWVDLRT